jgi:hypothetical protein
MWKCAPLCLLMLAACEAVPPPVADEPRLELHLNVEVEQLPPETAEFYESLGLDVAWRETRSLQGDGRVPAGK